MENPSEKYYEKGGPYRLEYVQSGCFNIVSPTTRTPRWWPKEEAEMICLWLNSAHLKAIEAVTLEFSKTHEGVVEGYLSRIDELKKKLAEGEKEIGGLNAQLAVIKYGFDETVKQKDELDKKRILNHAEELTELKKKYDALHDSRFEEARKVDALNKIVSEQANEIKRLTIEIRGDNCIIARQNKDLEHRETLLKIAFKALNTYEPCIAEEFAQQARVQLHKMFDFKKVCDELEALEQEKEKGVVHE